MALTLEQARQNALNRRKSITPQTAQQNITAEENKPENTGGLLGGVGYTLGRVGLGALRGLEGIWDFAAGGIADLFGADEWAYEQATESPFDDLTTELDAWYNPSEFMQFVGDVGAGVGQMLPSVAVAAIPGAGPALSTAMFTTSAAGMGVSDAAKTTGELGAKEWLYGGASGAVEGAIEKLSGGIGGTKLGTVLGKQVAKSTAGKVAATFVGEGLEEVASDLIDPALRRVTGVDPEATVDVSQLPNTFLVGGAAGAILGGGSRVLNAARSGGFNNLNAREDLATIREAQSRGNTLQNEGKLNAKWESTLSSKQTEAEQRLSSRLQKMDAETRGKFISDNNLASVFDADGNIRVAAEGYTAPKYNADAVSFSAREDLNRGTLQYAPTQKAVRADIKSAISDVTKISDGQGKYVVVDTLGTTNAGQKINGFYDRSTGVTYIANDGDTNGTKSFVVSHEYVHTLEGTNAYNKYAKEIIKQIESDPALKEKYNIDAYVETYRKAQPDYESETIAYIAQTEMIADFTANEILSNEDAVRRLANRNKSLVSRVYEWVKDKIKTLTSKGGSRENIAYLRKAERMLAKVLNVPTGGVNLDEENENIKKQKAEKQRISENLKQLSAENGARFSLSSIANTFFGNPDMSADDFSKANYKETKAYKSYVKQCLNNMRQTRKNFNENTAKKEIEDAIDGIIRVAVAAKKAGYDIYDNPSERNVRDSKDRLLFSSLEPNSDYFTSSDISTICDKRKNFTQIYEDIVRLEEEKGVPKGKRFFDNVDNYFYIHQVLAEKGLTQPCRECYVESMRKNLAPMANAFLRLVQETNPENRSNDQLYNRTGKEKGKLKQNNAKLRENVRDVLAEYGFDPNNLTVEMLTTSEGLAQIKIQMPLLYEAFNSFYGQSKPKMPKEAVPFRFGELTALLTNDKGEIKQSLVDKINASGGFRLQSYSDFQVQNYVDVLQVLFEAGTLGLSGHAYTKVPAFLDATENTNLKRNISVFTYNDEGQWKIDKNDSFPGTLEDIYAIVNADTTGDTGIIVVSQNADNAAWVMANNDIAFGIGYHKSGQKMSIVRETVVKEDGREIKGYSRIKDHTKQQSEVYARTEDGHKSLTKVKKPISIYDFWDFDNREGLSKKALLEKNLKAYIDACEREGYLPRFREYVMNNDDVLEKILRYAKELGFADANATISDISFQYRGYTIPYGYYKYLVDFQIFKPDGKASPHEVLSLKDYDFDKAVKFFEDSETVRRNEILQQFANGEERKRYRESDLTAEQLENIVKQKRKEVVDEIITQKNTQNKRFSISVDSEGNTLSEQQQEYFKDSKVRDENGKLLPVYHGSPNEFFVFDRNRMGKGNDQFGAGFYFATDEDASRHYGDKVIKSYLNIQKPIVINRTEDGGDLYDVHLTQKQAYEILKRHPKIYDAEESPLGDLFDEYWEVGPKDYMIRQAAKNLDSIGLMDSDYTAFRNYPNELHEAIREVLGYDGVEVRFDNSNEKFYVAWFENQIKQTSNKNPTGSADIRYSISQNQNTRDENYINNKLKTYTYADVESIVDNLTINKYGDDVVLRGKKNVGKQIYTLLNETPIRNRRAKAEQIARQIVYQNLAAQSLYNAEDIENARKEGIEISETWIDKKLSSQLSETENEALVKEIRDELLDSFETAGKLNATGKMYLRYKEVGDRLSKLLVKDSILKTARRMKKRNYPKAFEAFDGIRKILAKLEMRSDINEKSGRDIIKAFGEFYTASNEALQGYYSEEVRQAIDDFISYNGEGNLDLYELEQIDTILNAADHLLKEYDKAFLNGRTVSVTKTSSKAVNTVKENADLYKATVLGAMRLKGYVGSFFRSIVDTRTLAMWLDGGNKGIITELFDDIAKASTKQTITVMDLYDDFDKFIKKNKKFYKSLEQKVTFKFNGKDVEITRGEAISLYLTSLQEDGLYHLAFGGFAVGKDQNNIRRYVGQKPFYGKPEDVEQYESEVMQKAKKEFSALYDTFTETEKEYIRLARDLFNNKAKRIKQEIDIQRIGMTNANVENYFPERVYEVGRPLKQGNTYIQEMNLIANQSIHKDRVKGSKQTLYISPVNMVVMNHIRQIAMYNAYAIPIDTLRRVMNKNVSLTFDGKPNTAQAETLKTVIQETAWADFEKFLDKYMMDVQGGSFSNTTPDKIIRWMRSNYAKFQLGLNIKTMLSQLTSLPMAGSRLGWKNLLKGTFAKPNFEEMLKYSEWARARNYEGAAYKSQSLVDNVDKVGQLAMKPIGMVDLFTMNRIYNAAKYYIASRDGVSLDSVECKTKAAAMLEEIGRETQNNSEAAEKSSLMRSGNELIKSIVMFSSDAMKQFSTLMQSLNKIKFIKQKIKLGKGDKATLEKQLSSARKEARGAFASVGVSSAMYVLMGMLVNYGLFAKEPEDDESYIEIFLRNFGGSVTGMIPVVRDLYSFFVEGYELDNFAYETVNGLSEAVKNIGTLMERAGSGERVTDQEWMLAMRKFIYAAGQITGIPTRNLYNQIYGLIKRVSPSAAYDINSIFYGASTKDLDKAIQKGDTALSTTIAEQLLSDKGIDASKEVASVFSDLYSKGYSMPKGIPESITYNEEEISLNAKQQGIVIDAYSEAANKAEGLINSADWASLSDDAKANALKLLFNYYYYYGINKATGAYADNRTLLLGSAIDITKIASAYGKIAELTADTDKKGNVISGTKKAKVQRLVNSLRLSAAQKYILMGFLGYKNSNGESSVTSYIRNIGISQDMQTALFEMSGYEVS